MTPELSIVIPFHNEAESLEVLCNELSESISKLPLRTEVLFVDDASNDDSVNVITKFKVENDSFELLQLNERSGQTGAFRVGFAAARGRYIIRMDADLQDDPADLPLFCEKIERGYDVIVGLRECRKHSRILRLFSGAFDLLIIALFNSPLHSNVGSYICFKAEYVREIPFRKNDHRYLVLIAMRRGAEKFGEIFVRHRPRQFGVSKYPALRKILLGIPEVIGFLLRYYRGVYDKVVVSR